MNTTVERTLSQILQRGGGVVLDPAGPRMRAPESLIPLVKAHREEIRAVLEMSFTEYAERGVPLAVLVPWAPAQRCVVIPRALVVPGISRAQTWTISELWDLLTCCGHAPVTVLAVRGESR